MKPGVCHRVLRRIGFELCGSASGYSSEISELKVEWSVIQNAEDKQPHRFLFLWFKNNFYTFTLSEQIYTFVNL